MRCLAACAVLAAIVAGCAADGPRYQPTLERKQGEGLIYIYRPAGEVIGRGESPYVEVGDKSLGRLSAGAYVTISVPPGEHEVTARQTALFVPTVWRSVEVAVAAGSVSYVRVDQRVTEVGTAGTFSAMQAVSIEEVSVEEGQREIAETRANN
jgi:hypothetical protein